GLPLDCSFDFWTLFSLNYQSGEECKFLATFNYFLRGFSRSAWCHVLMVDEYTAHIRFLNKSSKLADILIVNFRLKSEVCISSRFFIDNFLGSGRSNTIPADHYWTVEAFFSFCANYETNVLNCIPSF